MRLSSPRLWLLCGQWQREGRHEERGISETPPMSFSDWLCGPGERRGGPCRAPVAGPRFGSCHHSLSLCSEHISMSVSKPGVEPGFPFQADLIRLWRILSKPPHILRVWGKRITELQESEQLNVHRQIKIEHPVI